MSRTPSPISNKPGTKHHLMTGYQIRGNEIVIIFLGFLKFQLLI